MGTKAENEALNLYDYQVYAKGLGWTTVAVNLSSADAQKIADRRGARCGKTFRLVGCGVSRETT